VRKSEQDLTVMPGFPDHSNLMDTGQVRRQREQPVSEVLTQGKPDHDISR
jgi:hypothetical protein